MFEGERERDIGVRERGKRGDEGVSRENKMVVVRRVIRRRINEDRK